jgi:hypothetical protein
MTYCSLAEARFELKATTTVDDDHIKSYIKQASARIDAIMAPRIRRPIFEPYIEQRSFLVTSRAVDSIRNSFTFKQPLLSIDSVLVGSQDVTSTIQAWPLGRTPIRAIRFVSQAHHWYEFCTSLEPVYVYITGTWGIHSDYANAWPSYDVVQATPLAPGNTTFTVADVDGDDPYGIAPRFSTGQLLRIGAGTEIMRMASTNTATNLVTVARAQNGSSLPADDYAAGSAVTVFQTEEQVRRIVARQAALMYERRGAFQVESLDGVGVITYPQDLLVELQQVLTEYQYA